jgi:hypothetical protein
LSEFDCEQNQAFSPCGGSWCPSALESLSLPAATGVRRWFTATALAAAYFNLAACGGPHFDGRVYTDGPVQFRLEHIPEHWRRIDVSDAALAFRDDSQAATVAVHGRCGRDAEDVPLEALTQHLFLEFTERQMESRERLMLDGREALSTKLVAKLDGVPKYFHVVVLKKNTCVYDFAQIAAAEQDHEAFLQFVRGFSSVN